MTVSAWRLTKAKHLASAWDGQGAKLSGGRWNSVGVPVVYTSGSLSLALVEVLVHLPAGLLPAFCAVPVEFDESLVTSLAASAMPANWKDHPPPPETRAIGDAWVMAGTSPVLKVPSVVVPMESNYVLSPAHPRFGELKIGKPIPFPLDPRLPAP